MSPAFGITYADLNTPPPMEALVRVTFDPSGLVNVNCNRSVVEFRGDPLRVASVHIVAMSPGKYSIPTSAVIPRVSIRVTVKFATVEIPVNVS